MYPKIIIDISTHVLGCRENAIKYDPVNAQIGIVLFPEDESLRVE